MDSETEKWPIPTKHRDEFDSMKFDFMACPLRVYRDKTFVEPKDQKLWDYGLYGKTKLDKVMYKHEQIDTNGQDIAR